MDGFVVDGMMVGVKLGWMEDGDTDGDIDGEMDGSTLGVVEGDRVG